MTEFTPRTNFKEKIDMSQLWLMHVNRTNMAAGNELGLYDAYVRQQLRLLPQNMQEWVMSNSDAFTDNKEYYIYKAPAGIRLGTKDDPLLKDPSKPVKRFNDDLIDWKDENILSPRMELKEVIDYERFNLFIMAAAEKAGLSWNVEIHTYDKGDVPENKKKHSQLQIRETDSGRKLPTIPTGYDTKIISTIPGTELSIINWHGTQVIQGTGYSPVFFDLIQERTNKENGTIIGTGGAPGEGKTWFDMRLAEIINRVQPGRSFNPYIQIPFTQEHFLWLLSADTPLELGDVIILDEAHFAAGARNWFKEDQKELVDMIASARNMGFIVILVVLHMDMLDKILRQFTMAFYIHLEKPGLATAYKTFTPRFNNEMIKIRIGPVTLQVPWVAECDHTRCLHCKNLYPKTEAILMCMIGRAIYERRKKEFQYMKVQASLKRRKESSKIKPSKDERLDAFEKHFENVIYTNQGLVEPAWINKILSEEFKEYTVSEPTARNYGKEWLLARHPEILRKNKKK